MPSARHDRQQIGRRVRSCRRSRRSGGLLARRDRRFRFRAKSANAFCLSPYAPPPWMFTTSAPTHSATSAWYSSSRMELPHFGAGRIQHDELIGVKAGSQLVLANELSALLKATNDFITFRQIIDLVSTGRMRFDRKNLAVDAKAANAVVGTELKGRRAGRRHSPGRDGSISPGRRLASSDRWLSPSW